MVKITKIMLRWLPEITCSFDPWLSVGFHIDHVRPYLAIHLPLVRLEIGWRLSEPCHSKYLGNGRWLLSLPSFRGEPEV